MADHNKKQKNIFAKLFQASNFSEYMYREIADVAGDGDGDGAGEESCVEGMARESIEKLGVCEYDHSKMNNSIISCSICLEVNMVDDELMILFICLFIFFLLQLIIFSLLFFGYY